MNPTHRRNVPGWPLVPLSPRRRRYGGPLGLVNARQADSHFLSSVVLIPCQVLTTARRMVLRILRYTPWAAG